MGERLVVEEGWTVKRFINPDIDVIERAPAREANRGGGTAVLERPSVVAVAQPLIVTIPQNERRETFVQIIDPQSNGHVITLIEFISPANKLPGKGRVQYQKKQAEAMDAGVSLVEIDLTRAGSPVFVFRLEDLPVSHRTPYLASAWRSHGDSDSHEVYRIPLRERLPVIGIPLRKDDRDATLDLQALIDLAYEEGRYDDIDYSRPPEPPIEDADQAWAGELLKAAKVAR